LDHDAIDIQIIQKIKDCDLSWFPINRSMEYEEKTEQSEKEDDSIEIDEKFCKIQNN